MKTVNERAIDVIVNHLGVNRDRVKPESSLTVDLGADSLDTVELVMGFEDEFNINIPDEYAGEIETVGDIIKYLEERVK